MSEEEIKEYLKRVDALELKLTGEDKDTYQWLLFGYNECARLLNEKEQENSQLKEDIKGFEQERQTLYNTIHDLKKANKQLNRKIDRGINKIEKAQKLIEVPTYPENIYLGFCYLFGKYNYDELPCKIKEALK